MRTPAEFDDVALDAARLLDEAADFEDADEELTGDRRPTPLPAAGR